MMKVGVSMDEIKDVTIMSEAEVMRWLGLTEKGLADLRNRKGLPYLELTRKVRAYVEKDIIEWGLKRRKVRGQ